MIKHCSLLVLNLLSILQISYYNLAFTVKCRLSLSPLHCSLFPSSSHLSFSLSTRLTHSIIVFYHSCLASARKAILDQSFPPLHLHPRCLNITPSRVLEFFQNLALVLFYFYPSFMELTCGLLVYASLGVAWNETHEIARYLT